MEIDYKYLHDALDRVEHTSTVDAFHHQFTVIQSLLTFLHPEIPDAYLASRFIYGLRVDFQNFLIKFKPITVLAAYKLASIYEESIYLDYFPEPDEMLEESSIIDDTLEVNCVEEALDMESCFSEPVLKNDEISVENVVAANILEVSNIDEKLRVQILSTTCLNTTAGSAPNLIRESAVSNVNSEVIKSASALEQRVHSSFCWEPGPLCLSYDPVSATDSTKQSCNQAITYAIDPGDGRAYTCNILNASIKDDAEVWVEDCSSEFTSSLKRSESTQVAEDTKAVVAGSVASQSAIQDTFYVNYKGYTKNLLVDVMSKILSMASLNFTVFISVTEYEGNSSFRWEPGPLSSRFDSVTAADSTEQSLIDSQATFRCHDKVQLFVSVWVQLLVHGKHGQIFLLFYDDDNLKTMVELFVTYPTFRYNLSNTYGSDPGDGCSYTCHIQNFIIKGELTAWSILVQKHFQDKAVIYLIRVLLLHNLPIIDVLLSRNIRSLYNMSGLRMRLVSATSELVTTKNSGFLYHGSEISTSCYSSLLSRAIEEIHADSYVAMAYTIDPGILNNQLCGSDDDFLDSFMCRKVTISINVKDRFRVLLKLQIKVGAVCQNYTPHLHHQEFIDMVTNSYLQVPWEPGPLHSVTTLHKAMLFPVSTPLSSACDSLQSTPIIFRGVCTCSVSSVLCFDPGGSILSLVFSRLFLIFTVRTTLESAIRTLCLVLVHVRYHISMASSTHPGYSSILDASNYVGSIWPSQRRLQCEYSMTGYITTVFFRWSFYCYDPGIVGQYTTGDSVQNELLLLTLLFFINGYISTILRSVCRALNVTFALQLRQSLGTAVVLIIYIPRQCVQSSNVGCSLSAEHGLFRKFPCYWSSVGNILGYLRHATTTINACTLFYQTGSKSMQWERRVQGVQTLYKVQSNYPCSRMHVLNSGCCTVLHDDTQSACDLFLHVLEYLYREVTVCFDPGITFQYAASAAKTVAIILTLWEALLVFYKVEIHGPSFLFPSPCNVMLTSWFAEDTCVQSGYAYPYIPENIKIGAVASSNSKRHDATHYHYH